MQTYELWPEFETWLEKYLQPLGYSLQRPAQLAQCILDLSESYQDTSSRTDWTAKSVKAAYLSYYFPLNYIRARKVVDEAIAWNFFPENFRALDWGCGPGTLTRALLNNDGLQPSIVEGVDDQQDSGKYFLDTPRQGVELRFNTQFRSAHDNEILMASYVLNELKAIPETFYSYSKLFILEPSTRQNHHSYQDLRSTLIERGYNILAPCPHHEMCPMAESKKDWCHDRVHWQQPAWFEKLEAQLPIKNRTLSFSYLIADKKPQEKPEYTRVVGDELREKGKTRWMICQNSERLFLSHLKRQGQAPEIRRGDRLIIEGGERKDQELRTASAEIKKL